MSLLSVLGGGRASPLGAQLVPRSQNRGDDPRRDGVDFGGFFGREELEFRRRGRFGGLVRVLGSSDDGGPVSGKPDGGDGGTAAREEIATTEIFDHK